MTILDSAKAYAAARWAEPETKASLTTAVAVTAAWGIGHTGLPVIAPSTATMITSDLTAFIVAALPGPISSAIVKQLFGADAPATAALRWHKQESRIYEAPPLYRSN